MKLSWLITAALLGLTIAQDINSPDQETKTCGTHCRDHSTCEKHGGHCTWCDKQKWQCERPPKNQCGWHCDHNSDL
ncbi:hypothetical protein BBP40_011169 [Aspergillus hancockii]|nr:hypothetical protein BBP40_011169 [Aspergillus hancockii]